MSTYSYRGNTYTIHNNNINVTDIISRLFYPVFIKLRDIIKDDRPLLNPFTDVDLKNNPLIQLLDRLGAYVDTSDRRKKKGILRFSLRDFSYGLIIQPNGYMRIDYEIKPQFLQLRWK
jgi:hypothetical protein